MRPRLDERREHAELEDRAVELGLKARLAEPGLEVGDANDIQPGAVERVSGGPEDGRAAARRRMRPRIGRGRAEQDRVRDVLARRPVEGRALLAGAWTGGNNRHCGRHRNTIATSKARVKRRKEWIDDWQQNVRDAGSGGRLRNPGRMPWPAVNRPAALADADGPYELLALPGTRARRQRGRSHYAAKYARDGSHNPHVRRHDRDAAGPRPGRHHGRHRPWLQRRQVL